MMKFVLLAAVSLSLSAVGPLAQAQDGAPQPQIEIKDGPGKEVFLQKCTACHALQDVLAQRKNRAGWENKVREMVSLGATLSSDDIKVITEYLSKQYGL